MGEDTPRQEGCANSVGAGLEVAFSGFFSGDQDHLELTVLRRENEEKQGRGPLLPRMEASSGVCHALSTAGKLAGNVIVCVQALCIPTCRSAQLDVFMMYYMDSAFSVVTVMCVVSFLASSQSVTKSRHQCGSLPLALL